MSEETQSSVEWKVYAA